MPDEDPTVQPAAGTPAVPSTPAPAAPVVRGHGGTEIPEERVSDIKARERRRFLKEHYGTEDEEQAAAIKANREKKIKRAEELEAEQEKARLANLSELDRVKEELRIEREKAAAEKQRLESQVQNTRSELELERQDVQISSIASKHVAPKFLKTAKIELGEYIETLTKAQLADFDQKKIDKWFRDFVKENPEFAPKAPAAAAKTPEEIELEKKKAATAAVPPKRAPIGAPRGTTVRRPPTTTQAAEGKGTYKGKKVKDLTAAELREYKKSIGMKPNW